MSVERNERGIELLVAHCASLDPDAPTARDRLEEALGPELARRLVAALAAGSTESERASGALRARAVFAA
jgi:hypothetical protein